ncbi:hypothetical protein K492DRAFT_211360 [Lichtheimia hyalospora FSU 10163]|nr:hypothetical protein K492DRAFT_211360 [Lichtheimia hyalospora FSU 10163]
MLQALKLHRTLGANRSSATVFRQYASSATKQHKSSIGLKLAGTALVVSTAAGGVVYYGLNDKAFHDTFVEHVPYGEAFLGYFEDLRSKHDIDAYRDQAATWKKQVQDYSGQAQNAVNGVYGYASDAYVKLTGQGEVAAEAPLIKDEKPIKVDAGSATITTDATSTAPTIDTTIEKPEPIVIKKISSDNAVIHELTQVLVELATILNDSNLADKGRDMMAEAVERLHDLNDSYKELGLERSAILNDLIQLKTKANTIAASLNNYHDDTANSLENIHVKTAHNLQGSEENLLNENQRERTKMREMLAELVAQELDAQKKRLENDHSEALLRQASQLKEEFVRQAKYLVEKERAGRLGKLEAINGRFSALESLSLKNAVELDKSRISHLMHITFGALQDAIEKPQKVSFVSELDAFRSSAENDALLRVVLDTIPREVAEEGVESMRDLTARFELVADQVRQVALVPEDGGFGSHIISMVMAKLMFRKQGLVQGNDIEAVLARSGYYLKNGDLENAARELNQLTGWPKRLACDWIEAARRHLEIKQALQVAETTTVLNSLLET